MEELDELKQIIFDNYSAKLPILNLDTPIELLNKIASKLSSQLEPPVIVEFADIKKEVTKHFDSENIILDNVEDVLHPEEYKFRKRELERQRFYINLILSKFSE